MKTGPIATISHAVSVLHGAADVGVCHRRYAEQLHEAKLALVELIEAAKEVTDAFRAIGNDRTVITPPGLVTRAEEAMKRLDAANTRAGGSP